ncbi:MAG: methyltransferase domain-containing protein [Gammaproteobacteria bacterium]|jgi:tellurite methyltransferase|nr:methyltransferase domain-containing protein [Gammaproteobacteria bacterium]MBT4494606.1 methyltransferase domain-containing protein [Gammaproteobacteria bacterium]MBT7371454.1 methyltransferase domain-containing protein [Gammaproteobacteria bacterium]
MDQDRKSKWNRIYSEGSQQGRPAAVLIDNVDLIPDQGHACDIACGRGVNTLALARAGMKVDAWDISNVAITALQQEAAEAGLEINASTVDITPSCFAGKSYDLILNCHYLDRQLIPAMVGACKPGGLILFQTFTEDKADTIGPRNREFLLARDELPGMFSGFDILTYRDESRNENAENPLTGRAYIIARKPQE